MKKYIVETVSIFRIRYCVEAEKAEYAADEVVCNLRNTGFKEFSQHHVDEVISSVREVSETEYLKLFDEDNDYLKGWDNERKLSFVNKIKTNEK